MTLAERRQSGDKIRANRSIRSEMDGGCQYRTDTGRALEAVLVAAEETAAEILKNPATKARYAALINAAIDRALVNENM